MEAAGAEHMGLDARQERLQRNADRTHGIGQRRQRDGDAFAGELVAQAVEGLVGPELLAGDERQQARSGPAARDGVERRRGLADRLAIPAGELLPHGLDNLPRARDALQCLGDILAELAQAVAAAALAGRRCFHHDAFARQMGGEIQTRPRRPALECSHLRGPGEGRFGRQFLLGCGRLRVLEGEFRLLDEPLAALGLLAPHLVLQSGDDELLVGDERLVLGRRGPGDGDFGEQPLVCGDECRDLFVREPARLRHDQMNHVRRHL